MPYVVYRQPGGSKRAWQAPNHLYRLVLALLLALLASLGVLAQPVPLADLVQHWDFWLLPAGLVWFTCKARGDLAVSARKARWLARPAPPTGDPD